MPVVQRTSRKLWLPSDHDRAQLDQDRYAQGCFVKGLEGFCVGLIGFGCSQPSKAQSQAAEDTDDLDALLDSYDQAAQADKKAVEQLQKKERKPASMTELRTEGLANPLTADNRCARLSKPTHEVCSAAASDRNIELAFG